MAIDEVAMSVPEFYAKLRATEQMFDRRVHTFVDSRTNADPTWYRKTNRHVWQFNTCYRAVYHALRTGIHE